MATTVTLPEVPAVAAAGGVAAGGAIARDRIARRSQIDRRPRYRLERGENPADGVRRIACGQIDLAAERLQTGGDDLGDAVHDARKSFKRVRALLRLARDELGDEVYRRENAAFREAGRRLSYVRDAKVVSETLDGLVGDHRDEIPAGAFGGLRDALGAEARAAHERLENDATAIDAAVAMLEAARARVATWPLREDAGLEILEPGFRRIHRRGRRARRRARKDTTTENLHELRKRAKDSWHAAQVVRPAAPKRFKKLARGAHDLADVVGEDHDLAVLLDAARERGAALRPGELALLEALVDRHRAKLQRKALRRGRRVYARKPRKLARRLSGARPRG